MIDIVKKIGVFSDNGIVKIKVIEEFEKNIGYSLPKAYVKLIDFLQNLKT